MRRFVYHKTDEGNCRVYYTYGRKRYCFQEEAINQFLFYVCSRDGEPSHPIPVDSDVLECLNTPPCINDLERRFWQQVEDARSRMT